MALFLIITIISFCSNHFFRVIRYCVHEFPGRGENAIPNHTSLSLKAFESSKVEGKKLTQFFQSGLTPTTEKITSFCPLFAQDFTTQKTLTGHGAELTHFF